jgi:hypothetical protein
MRPLAFCWRHFGAEREESLVQIRTTNIVQIRTTDERVILADLPPNDVALRPFAPLRALRFNLNFRVFN